MSDRADLVSLLLCRRSSSKQRAVWPSASSVSTAVWHAAPLGSISSGLMVLYNQQLTFNMCCSVSRMMSQGERIIIICVQESEQWTEVQHSLLHLLEVQQILHPRRTGPLVRFDHAWGLFVNAVFCVGWTAGTNMCLFQASSNTTCKGTFYMSFSYVCSSMVFRVWAQCFHWHWSAFCQLFTLQTHVYLICYWVTFEHSDPFWLNVSEYLQTFGKYIFLLSFSPLILGYSSSCVAYHNPIIAQLLFKPGGFPTVFVPQ